MVAATSNPWPWTATVCAVQQAGGGLVGAHQARHRDAEREHLRRVVVAADGDDLDALPQQAAELLDQELAGAPVLPVAVVEVAGEEDELDLPLEGEVDHVDDGVAGGAADALDRGLGVQALQGAVEVQVGGVEEAEVRHGGRLPERAARVEGAGGVNPGRLLDCTHGRSAPSVRPAEVWPALGWRFEPGRRASWPRYGA